MKKILWVTPKFNIEFNLNWLEFIFLKNIFKQKRIKIIKNKGLRGRTAKLIVIDEFAKNVEDFK